MSGLFVYEISSTDKEPIAATKTLKDSNDDEISLEYAEGELPELPNEEEIENMVKQVMEEREVSRVNAEYVVDLKNQVIKVTREAIKARALASKAEELAIKAEALAIKAEALGKTDTLTGVNNLKGYNERITQELTKVQRHGGDLTLVMIDIDHFKSINDNFGPGKKGIKMMIKHAAYGGDTVDVVGTFKVLAGS